ncbi:MAG: DUF2147 domain-containing protein [Pseudomonadota bacterium]
MKKLAICVAAMVAAPAWATSPPQGPQGLWLTEKKGVILDVYACGEAALCARTVWLKKMNHKDGAPRLDAKNPDAALRERHWCGIEVIRGVAEDGPGKWEGGKIYDPKTGLTFDFDMKLDGDQMKVRGYKVVRAIGKSETWTRTDGAGVEFCDG